MDGCGQQLCVNVVGRAIGGGTMLIGDVLDDITKIAQPVPPIYQPEVAAEAVYWAAHHTRRELDVGSSTVVAIWGNKFFAGVGDRYLAATGFKSQQTDKPEDPDRPNNLWHPVDETKDYGAHGAFGARAHDDSVQLKVDMVRDKLAYGALAAGVAALGLWMIRR